MPSEQIFADFSGGMNAISAVDKCAPNEALLAENVRLDETGDILSAGAVTRQNAPLGAAVHSLYWNPSLGVIAGVGQDVYKGTNLNTQTNALSGRNSNSEKMSFASAPDRVYFDVGEVGYWSDLNNLLTVDWAPPSASSAIASGPNTNTAITSSAGFATTTNYGFSVGTSQNMQGVQLVLVMTGTVGGSGDFHPAHGTATNQVTVSLLVGGVPVGTSTSASDSFHWAGPELTHVSTFTLGNQNTLWGYPTLTQAQVNATNFGFKILYGIDANADEGIVDTLDSSLVNPNSCTVYQASAGFNSTVGTAGTLTGTYTWKITFVGPDGEESDASIASDPTTLSAQQGTLTAITTGDARTTARNIYRKGGSLTSYYLVGSIPDNSTTTYSDNLTDIAALATGVILAGDVPGDYPNSRLGNQVVRYPAYHYDRVFWVVPGTNKVIWSKPLNGFAYPSVNFFNVGDGKPISRIISIFGELIIIKTDSIWRLTGTDEASFDLSQTPSAVGTDWPFTIVALPDKILFANRWGLWVFNGYTSQPFTNKLDLWFKQDDRTGTSLFGVNGFHPIDVTTSTGANFDACGNSDKYYLTYAEAGQSTNNAVLVFDIKHGNITKRAGTTPQSLSIDPVNGYVYMGDAAGFIDLLDDWNGTGNGTNFDYQHSYQDLARGSNKALWALEFFLNTHGQSLTPSVYYDNGLASETLAAISTTSLQRVVRTMEATQARKLQNFSWRLNGTLTQVNNAGSPQVQIVHVKALYDLRVGRARTGQT